MLVQLKPPEDAGPVLQSEDLAGSHLQKLTATY
jgi:hypothetical protein